MQEDIRTDVDFVLTYEELMGIFEAKEINFSALPGSPIWTRARGPDAALPWRAAWLPQWRN